jgi:predicted GH43/DUF377 family glycosyl hydrolase
VTLPVVRIDAARLLPADYVFNPSLIEHEGVLWMIYRRVHCGSDDGVESWTRTLAACQLTSELVPVEASHVDLSPLIHDAPGARRWHADGRLFRRSDGPWVYFHDNDDLYAFRFRPEHFGAPIVPVSIDVRDRPRRQRERNWGFFEDGGLRAVYSIQPHHVLAFDESPSAWTGAPLHESVSAIPWNSATWGEPHGGSPPVRVGEHWFSFFHSNVCVDAATGEKVYRVGFYGFDAEPPYRLRYMTRSPIIDGAELDGPRSFYCNHAVAYPSGAVYSNGRWILALGIHDRAMGFVTLDHNELVSQCQVLE